MDFFFFFSFFFLIIVFVQGGSPTPHPFSSRPHFLNQREGGTVSYQVETHCRNCKRLREFEEIKISR
jgi:hypothetical protein